MSDEGQVYDRHTCNCAVLLTISCRYFLPFCLSLGVISDTYSRSRVGLCVESSVSVVIVMKS